MFSEYRKIAYGRMGEKPSGSGSGGHSHSEDATGSGD